MPAFAANLSLMFTEWDFLDRFDAAAEAGFTAVEYLFPYDYPPEIIAARLQRNGLTQALFNGPPGDQDAGERGLASLPGREAEFRRSVETALEYARVLGNERLHLMAGLIAPGAERARHRETYVNNLAYATYTGTEDGGPPTVSNLITLTPSSLGDIVDYGSVNTITVP